ncbi:MAG TPA: nucleotidyltransferase family protein [Chloroflexota bacterium]|jgi:uncharacterized protein|nr:nucleotidyltransferase family protein [Chloroflexota bacterium]
MALSVRVAEHREVIRAIAEKHGGSQIRVFGSMVNGRDRADSDLDLLVEFEQGRSLFDQVSLIQELEDLLKLRVDVVDACSLHPLIRDRVLAEAIPL